MINSAFVFPGQGSQFVGMLAELASQYSLIRDTFSQASERVGYDIWQLTQEGSEERLNQTEHTQVAMLTADVAVFRLLQKLGALQPQIMAGHSLGEYAALVCSSAIDLPDAAQLVAKRGELMQKFVPRGRGAMAAIVGLTDEQVERLCEGASNSEYQVTPANYNAIGQVVIAGHAIAVEEAIKLAEDAGARMAKIIPVSVPCHCPLLRDAANAFAEELANANFRTPEVAVISNVDLSTYQSPSDIRTLLKEQLYRPVQWVETIQLMRQRGVERVIECGPGKVLSGLVKRIDKTLVTLSVNDVASLEQALAQSVEESF
ncbi:malonyl CoA-ACP transacylase [Legionella lansingensis]|uniref:Malonyl CoA-acyl carrier protein transacylase n=1 Tax=Legionella lansingensis TaxID=45067 RepID=A0A0W0VQ79_9GAMM|nr:ACP S-malonyltransferase [Legionella lansingensis]KTD22306.1 malonyl CoA-ACP transacylase [Legionella lansingensis]SNV50707.1 malonyl CoA-ACP transacylase [Legionella lansingensis]